MSKSWKRHNSRLSRFEQRLWPRKNTIVAGVDEAGRGPLAGPVVAAAVILKSRNFTNKIFDSKKLSFSSRHQAFREISHQALIGIGVVGPQVIDQVNILQATILAIKKAVDNLAVRPEFLLVDGRFNSVSLPGANRCLVKGDQLCLSIACASIVAKVFRDELMSDYSLIYPEYNFALNRGYGTRQHLRAIKKYGIAPIHRRSFCPINKLARKSPSAIT